MLPVLKSGDGIGLVAPAGNITADQINASVSLLENQDFKLKFAPHLFGKYRYFSGSIEERVNDIHTFLRDPDIQSIYAVRGGVGSSQLLSEMDFELWRSQQKLLIGFSDITALQWALWNEAGIGSISGMTLTSQLTVRNPYLDFFWNLLSGQKTSMDEKTFTDLDIGVLRSGTAEGMLMGGTLSIITTLLGTPFWPETDSVILFLEDVNEPLYRIERMLVQLKLAGFMNRVNGIIFGQFKFEDKVLDPWRDLEYLFPSNIPIVTNFPYGHMPHSCPMPCGVRATINTNPFHLEWETR